MNILRRVRARTTLRRLARATVNIVPKSANSPFHLQNDPDFCGAAVGLMMLSDKDVGRNPVDLPELDLFQRASGNRVGLFKVSPDGLTKMLNDLRPPSARAFAGTAWLSEKAGTATVVAHLCDSSTALGAVSPAVLIFGDMHWV